MLAKNLTSGAGAKLWVDECFSSFVYTGNGSTQTINNGIDLAGKGGLVWIKCRGTAGTSHCLTDSVRGLTKTLYSELTLAQTTDSFYTSFNSNGYTLNTSSASLNANLSTYVSWTFRKSAKFFDIQTGTTNGSGAMTINHSLGITPGMVITKNLSTGNWYTFHRSLTNQYATLNTTNAFAASTNGAWSDTTVVFANSQLDVSANYVVYLFAHDASTDGIIQCGSFTTDGSGNATVNLGWEPQYVMIKCSSTTGPWVVADSSRGFVATASNTAYLVPNTSGAEATATWQPNATGFTTTSSLTNSGATYIYLAIRRPNKPPTTGTQVYSAIARTGTGAAAAVTGVGFAPDWVVAKGRTAGGFASLVVDRLRGATAYLKTPTTAAEATSANSITSLDMGGISVGADATNEINFSGSDYINWFFKRAPGVFDVVCLTVTAGTNVRVTHNLGVAPELIIFKRRGVITSNWNIYAASEGVSKYAYLNLTNAFATYAGIWGTAPTSTDFGYDQTTQATVGDTWVAYLFATLAGVSKVFSYTGDGSTGKVINCGFGAGARFILIKRTDSTGDWFVYDTTRTYPAGNDYHLSLNTTAAEVVTTDDVDYEATGFIVNQNATTNLNVTSATYIGLAFS